MLLGRKTRRPLQLVYVLTQATRAVSPLASLFAQSSAFPLSLALVNEETSERPSKSFRFTPPFSPRGRYLAVFAFASLPPPPVNLDRAARKRKKLNFGAALGGGRRVLNPQ